MTPGSSRSDQLIDDFRKRRVARSALRRIQEIIQGFERERVVDRRLARIGLVIILGPVALAAYFFLRSESTTVSLLDWPARI